MANPWQPGWQMVAAIAAIAGLIILIVAEWEKLKKLPWNRIVGMLIAIVALGVFVLIAISSFWALADRFPGDLTEMLKVGLLYLGCISPFILIVVYISILYWSDGSSDQE